MYASSSFVNSSSQIASQSVSYNLPVSDPPFHLNRRS